LAFFRIFNFFSLFNLDFFHFFHIISHFNLLFFHIFYVITVFTVFQLLTDFFCKNIYEFWLSLCKTVRSSLIVLLPLFTIQLTFLPYF
jgi:hypothetical protein